MWAGGGIGSASNFELITVLGVEGCFMSTVGCGRVGWF